MHKMKFTVERIVENANGKIVRTSTKTYTLDGDLDDVLDWFEDTYRDDTPIDKGTEPNTYFLSKATNTGFITYKLTIK